MSDRPLLDLMEETRKRRNPARAGEGTDNRKRVYRSLDPAKISGRKAQILGMVRSAGASGLTCKEAAAILGVGTNCISGRFTDLIDAKLIVPVRVNGEVVMRGNSIAYVVNNQP